jgi:hypothetical protein
MEGVLVPVFVLQRVRVEQLKTGCPAQCLLVQSRECPQLCRYYFELRS